METLAVLLIPRSELYSKLKIVKTETSVAINASRITYVRPGAQNPSLLMLFGLSDIEYSPLLPSNIAG